MSNPFVSRLRVLVLGTLAAGLLTLLNFTLRWKRSGLAADSNFWASGAKVIAFWHDSQLCMPFAYALVRRERPDVPQVYTLISEHSDGRIIAWAIKLLGLDSVAGSSTRGGLEGLLQLIQLAKSGQHVAITPDGPRGPRHKSKRGVVVLARETGFPLCPAVLMAERRWEFDSWDRMFLPKPFSRMVVHVAEPMLVPKTTEDAELPRLCEELEQRLARAHEEAARAFVS